MSSVLTVPGVYFEPKPREPELPFVRTDVAGLIGFEPRVRDGTTPSRLTGGPPPVGHEFQIDIAGFTLEDEDFRLEIPAQTDFTLSADAGSTLLASGQSVVFGLAAVQAGVRLLAVQGTVGITAPSPAPTRNELAVAVASAFGSGLPFERIADVEIARVGDAAVVAIRAQGARSHVRDGTSPSRFTGGAPPTGHSFQVDIESFEMVLGGSALAVPETTNFTLSSDVTATLLAAGERVAFAVVAVRTGPGLVSAQGSIVTAGPIPAPAPAASALEAEVEAAFGPKHAWRRIADIEYVRELDQILVVVRPALPPSACEDFRDYVRRFGAPVEDGTLLGPSVRAFFANGAARCWVTTVERPKFSDAAGLQRARQEMLGVKGSRESEATGLERLLLINEVSVIDAPDLYARHVAVTEDSFQPPPSEASACFQRCDKAVLGPVQTTAVRIVEALEPLYDDADVFETQRAMVERVIPERWRTLLLLNAPLELDPSDGKYHGPTPERAISWREQFTGLAEEHEISCAAFYFPWVLSQEKTGDPVIEMPPTPFVAGVIARRDLARGAHVAPANETLRAVVGLTRVVNDEVHGNLYAPPRNINVLRPFPGFGIQVWGARTLSNDKYLRYLSVRRCLSAIERRVAAALDDVVFEPHTAILWLRVTQIVFQVLSPLFESGALRGERPEQAFFVRCDASNNPPEAIAQGQLLLEVGVAIAAPAEFIIFRVGRKEGVTEVLE
jgi:hypothetical protein